MKLTNTKISCCIALFMVLMSTLPLKPASRNHSFAGYQTGGQIYTTWVISVLQVV